MRVKLGHKIFDIVPVEDDLLMAICEDGNSDIRIRMDGDVICIRYGVDKMWLVSKKGGAFLVKPKTYSKDELVQLVKLVLQKCLA